MADDTAHVPAEPGDDHEAGVVDAFPDENTDAAAEEHSSDPARIDSASEDGLEVIGWPSTAAVLRSRELVAVGSGESEGSASASYGEETTEPSPWSAPRSDVVDDAPRWSFPGVSAAPPQPSTPPSPARGDEGSQPELALEPAVPLAPPRPMPMFGPVGRTRSAALVAVVSALTLGVYALVWHHTVNREMEEFDPKLHARPRRSMVALLVPWLAGLLVTLAGAALVITSRLRIHLPLDPHITTTQAYYLLAGLGAIPYLVLLLPFSLVAVVMTLERLRSVEEHVGATTDRQVRPVGTSLLLAIPVVGGLLLLATEQRRLNDVWQAVTPSGHLKR